LERENLIFDEKNVEEVFNLCSTEQSCINIGITCYKIGTLEKYHFYPYLKGKLRKLTSNYQENQDCIFELVEISMTHELQIYAKLLSNQ
jgi:hypothetical protein